MILELSLYASLSVEHLYFYTRYSEKITDLNKELAALNDRVHHFSTTATRLEEQSKKMESKYEEQLKLQEKLAELRRKKDQMIVEQTKVSRGGIELNLLHTFSLSYSIIFCSWLIFRSSLNKLGL